MNLQIFDDAVSSKQLFLCSLISNDEVREIMEGSINGGYYWNFDFSQDRTPETVGAIHITSQYISTCMRQLGGDSIVKSYWHYKSFVNDVSLLYLIAMFEGLEVDDGRDYPRGT